MASCNFVFYLIAAMFLAACSAAPTDDLTHAIKIPAACKNQEFCTIKPEGYDLLEDEINKALPEFLQKDYGDRYGPSEEEILSPEDDWHNCPYITKTQSMFLYNHGGNDTKIDIFVQTKLFKQYIEVVTCASDTIAKIAANSDEQCFSGLGVSNFHLKSECVTSTAKRTLYVYDTVTKKVIQKSYEVPACCKCRVTNMF